MITMTTDPTYVLALDFGTQSVRAIIVDDSGNIIAKGQQAMPPYHSPEPGMAELPVSAYWQTLSAACADLWQRSPVTASDIAAVTLTTQRGTMICLDKDRQPLRPAMLWLDQRTATVLPRLGSWRSLVYRSSRKRRCWASRPSSCLMNCSKLYRPAVWG